VTGKDLKDLGYSPGPVYREILDKVLDARLNVEVTDRQSEFEWIRRKFPLKGRTASRTD
jgi:tRNA nucleotidyltransferase (CCA-adding enzyme)